MFRLSLCSFSLFCLIKWAQSDLVIVDTDMGKNDALALLMLLSNNTLEIQVMGLTTVAGANNASGASSNAFMVLHELDEPYVPIYQGSEQGLVYENEHEPPRLHVGDFGYYSKINEKIQSGHASQFMAEIVRRYPGKFTIAALGPLTNIAIAMHLNERFMDDIKELVIFGGNYKGLGASIKEREFNIFADPEAAFFVFDHAQASKVTLIPAEVSHSTNFTMAWRKDTLGALSSMKFINRVSSLNLREKEEFWYPYEEIVAGYLINPEIVEESEKAFFTVETDGEFSRGATIPDKSAKPNLKVVHTINSEKLAEVFLSSLN